MVSVLQVVSSSRIGNAIYITAGYVIGTWLLTIWQVPILPTVETALIVIPFSAFIGAILWATEPERHFIEAMVGLYVQVSPHGRATRKLMARCILLIRPWQTSIRGEDRIQSVVSNESTRVLRSQPLRNDVEKLSQLFWLVLLSFPVLFLFGQVHESLEGSWLALSILFSFAVSFPVLWQKRRRRFLVLWLALSIWITETISTTARRRKTLSAFRDSSHYAVAEQSTIDSINLLSSELIRLSVSKDWEGVFRNGRDFANDLKNTVPGLSLSSLDDFWRDVVWYCQNQDPSTQTPIPRIVFANLIHQMTDAILELYDWEGLPEQRSLTYSSIGLEHSLDNLQTVERDVCLALRPTLSEIGRRLDEPGFFRIFPEIEEVYALLTPFVVANIESGVLADLLRLILQESGIERLPDDCRIKIERTPARIVDIAHCLVLCVDKGLCHLVRMLESVTKWYPRFQEHQIRGQISLVTALEEDIGISHETVQVLLSRALLLRCQLNAIQVANALLKYKDHPVYAQIRKTLLDSIRTCRKNNLPYAVPFQIAKVMGFIEKPEDELDKGI